MKVRNFVGFAFLMLCTVNSYADLTATVCKSGDESSDTHAMVALLEDGLSVQLHESNFSVGFEQVNYKNNTFVIANEEVVFSGEGEQWKSTVSALFVLNEEGTKMNATLVVDGDSTILRGTEMKCVVEKIEE